MRSILPAEFHDDIPTGFNVAGHVGEYNRPPPPTRLPHASTAVDTL